MNNRIFTYLDSTVKEQFQLLKALILQSSHTLDKEGVDKVGELIRTSLSDCNLHLEKDEVDVRGDNLLFRSAACANSSQHILLSGHMDTVFPRESTFNTYREDKTRAYGPGVIDMKGGLVVAVFVLRCLEQLGLLEKIPLVLICSSDEEMGSIYSTPVIKNEAKKSLCGLVFECGGLNGEIVTGRNGKAGYHLNFFGKAGHAAFTGRNGKASAILELAHKTILLEQLNDKEKGIVVNVGRIAGGAAANIVAEKASAEIDIRYKKEEDGQNCIKQIESILAEPIIPGTKTHLASAAGRFPMEQSPGNTALFHIVKNQAELLDLNIEAEFRSGVSDANTLAECGVPVIDGLGPVGDFDHSDMEYMEKSTLVSRCKLATMTVIDIWKRYSEGKLEL